MEFQIAQKKIEYIVQISNDVPQQILCDQKRFKQVLFNLVGNALKFTFKGYLKVSVDYINKHLVTYVEDSGIGIKKEEQA